jgi:uncharacterized protein with GYD domain
MFFIALVKWKDLPTEKLLAGMNQVSKTIEELEKKGIKISLYWTLGRYDAVAMIEAPTEKDAMKILIGFRDIVDTETMVAVSREEAVKLV